jgi:hypothetical protein
MFEEEEEPVTNDMTRRAKRARQRSAVVEELEEFYAPQEESETIEHLDAEMSASECTYNGCRQGKMPPTKFQSSDGHIFNAERDFAKQQVTFMFDEEEEQVTTDMARRTKKAAKRDRQRSAKYGPAAVVEVGSWSAPKMNAQQGRGEPSSRPQPLHQPKQLLACSVTGKILEYKWGDVILAYKWRDQALTYKVGDQLFVSTNGGTRS